jgi:SpoVK/Ycf46/Vps4 family AAA+-type ATPase
VKADWVKALIKAQVEGDNTTFKTIALQIAAKEASAGHSRFAKEIRELIDKLDQYAITGQHAGRPNPVIPIARPSGELSSLLLACYPNERLGDMVLNDKTGKILKRVLDEQRHHQLFASHGLTSRRKLLLVGPPGCGKTMTAKVLAGELGRPLFIVRLEGLLSRYLLLRLLKELHFTRQHS